MNAKEIVNLQIKVNQVEKMGKDLLTWFEEKYLNNRKGNISCADAFNKTINEIGFEPYSSYRSFATSRTKRGYKRRKPKK